MTIVAKREAHASFSLGCAFETSPEWRVSEVSKETASLENGGSPSNSATGTLRAINRLTLSVAANCPKAEGRGGARNRANRASYALTDAQTANLSAAERHSAAIGLPLNRMITIHWKAAGMALESMAKATGSFIDRLTKWLSRKDHNTAWLWVHENAGGKGWHCHILIHVPDCVVSDLPAAQKRWLRQITGKAYSRGVIKSKPIGGRLGLVSSNPQLHFENSKVALTYVLKGQTGGQGQILGRRCSTSQNIGLSARKKAYNQRK